MIPSITTFSADSAKRLRGVFFDIDDTFTTRGKIGGRAFQSIWDLKKAGLRVVPITGRPAGWCDHIARMWPVDGVVGENGAFYFCYDEERGHLVRRFLDPEAVREKNRLRLERIREEILASIPGTALASDQLYREADLAIDYCEDVTPLPFDQVERICQVFLRHGANCKVSSIHVNGWFGDYDKLSMTRTFALERWTVDLDRRREEYLFCGDSPNDEPMFRFFPLAAGVNNVLRFGERMEHLPAFVADREGGDGFAEIAETVLRLRRQKG
ncbi:MAG: HAD-IIB family hydrolase [Deltaproteobacteria bacterium]|nr:HAD-IIB family hydrolase [Deltaproteobacteria bacterium]